MEWEKDFAEQVLKIYGKENYEIIEKAFRFAEKKHKGQFRQTGEEYITHPYNVAKILVGFKADVDTVVSGFLHDCLEDTDCTSEEIKKNFGDAVCNICESLLKIEPIKKARREHEEENENLRKMILTLGKDARVAFVKLADRLHNMQTLDVKSNQDKLKISKETLDIYVAIAERLGMNGLKHTLEDLCFKYILPNEYAEITAYLNEYYTKSKNIIEDIRGILSKLAEENSVDARIQSRVKSTFGVYKKTLTRSKEKIYDIIAHRIIVKDIKNCYTMLGAVHNLWKPVDGRIKDYIANPKKNLYRSLHTTVLYPTENGTIPVEIQIRTEEMHIFCEYGMAAHWMYKEHGSKATSVSGNSALYKMKKSMSAASEKVLQEDETDEFLQIIKTGFYSNKIFVFTPQKNVIELPEGAIPLDFAYAVHTNVGNKCTGAKVNGKIVPITTKLETGDVVEILTNSAKTPSRDWIKICKSSSAISKIKNYFKKEHKEENIKIGKEMLEESAKRKGCTLAKIVDEKEVLAEIMQKRQYVSLDEVFAAIGYGGLSASIVVNKFVAKQQQIQRQENKRNAPAKTDSKSDEGLLIDGHGDLMQKLAKCCNPIPGDDIIAYVSTGRGVIVHRADCENVDHLDASRFISARWNLEEGDDFNFTSVIDVYAKNKNNVYVEIANALSELGIKVLSLNSSQSKNEELALKIGVQIKNKTQLQQAKNKLASLSLVYEVVWWILILKSQMMLLIKFF